MDNIIVSAKSYQVLIVDDTPSNIDVLKDILVAEGYSISIATSGEVALDLIPRSLPDLILMDVMMPGLDGFEVCQKIKSDASTSDIPVIFITAKTEIEDIVKGFDVGGVDYIIKPFQYKEIVSRVKMHLQNRTLIKRNETLILELRKANIKFDKISKKDPLTGLSNLEESESRLRGIMDNTSAIIYIKDLQERYTLINHQFENLFGLSTEQIIGKTDHDLFSKKIADVLVESDREVFESGTSVELEEVMFINDITQTYITNKFPLFDSTGNICGVCGISTDITERKKSEEQLEFIQHGVDHAADAAFWLQLEDARFSYVNKQACESLGYTQEELLTMSVFDIDPEYQQKTWSDFQKNLREKKSLKIESLHQKKNGEPFPVELNIHLASYHGKDYSIAIARDITERKKLEAELIDHQSNLEVLVKKRTSEIKEKERQLSLITNNLPALISYLDLNYCYRFNNRAYQEWFGYSQEELFGKHIKEVLGEEVFLIIENYLKTALSGTSVTFEYLLPHKDGGERFVNATYIPHSGEEGKVEGLFILVSDITQRKQAEESIIAALKEKELLLREIQHRTKNNLQVISSMLSLQLLNIQDENYRNMFQDALTRIRTMATSQDRIYQSSNVANINFGDYIHAIVNDVFRAYEKPGRSVTSKIDCCQCNLDIDTIMSLGLVTSELVSNSLKHGFPEKNEGETQITLRTVGENKYEFVVKDNGVGLPKDFDLQNTKTVGMVLIRALVEDNLQGQLEINHGEGAGFKVTFPK